jgi:hypothetical protein
MARRISGALSSARVVFLCLPPEGEDFGDGPGLRVTAARVVREVAVKDFRDGAHRTMVEVLVQTLKKGADFVYGSVLILQGAEVGADEPAPDGAVVVGAVKLLARAAMLAFIVGVFRREGAEADGGEEVLGGK